MPPLQEAIIVVAGITGLVAVAAVMIPDRTDRVLRRLESMRPAEENEEVSVAPLIGAKVGDIGMSIADSPLIGKKEQEKMIATLGAAGFAGKDKLAIFIALKVTLAVVFGLLAFLLVHFVGLFQSSLILRAMLYLGLILLGWRGPDLVLGGIGRTRRRRLRDGISDALDLMVICTEAGLGLEQGMDRVARDIAIANPIVAKELRTTVAEMRVLPQMRDALDNFAKRSNMQIVRSVVTTLVQSIQYGTPLAHSLRVLSAEMRTHRMLEIERKAARLPVLLTIPLIFFILPCLFFIVAGPAMLSIYSTFKGH